jgi:hypothetical protein
VARRKALSSQVIFRPKRLESFVADRKFGIASPIFIKEVGGLNQVIVKRLNEDH